MDQVSMKLLGIDIGGTFTDLYLVDNVAAEQTIHKVSTTPDEPATGALTGIEELCSMTGTAPESIDYVLHGTTIATNAVLEHDGVGTGITPVPRRIVRTNEIRALSAQGHTTADSSGAVSDRGREGSADRLNATSHHDAVRLLSNPPRFERAYGVR